MKIVVLGGGISPKGELPDHSIERLEKAIELASDTDDKILVSGKYSFIYPDYLAPSLTEAAAMKKWLLEHGVDEKKIETEELSQDTISNAFYVKTMRFMPSRETEGTIITSDFHLKRVQHVFKRIFGPEYDLTFVGTHTKGMSDDARDDVMAYQDMLLKGTKNILKDMEPGDHEYMRNKLFTIPYYTDPQPQWAVDLVAEGKKKKKDQSK